MPVTIKDVARESGVNISTVSRALNNGYGVNDQTREHVIAVAARLNYRPDRIARGLATGRSHSLGLIISDIRNPFFAEVARGAEDTARTGNCDLVLCNSDLDADKQMQYVQSLLEKRIDGIMMNSVSMLSQDQQSQLAGSGVPLYYSIVPLRIIHFPRFVPTTNREALWQPVISFVSAIEKSPILPDRASTATSATAHAASCAHSNPRRIRFIPLCSTGNSILRVAPNWQGSCWTHTRTSRRFSRLMTSWLLV
jgi:hypothetical protein